MLVLWMVILGSLVPLELFQIRCQKCHQDRCFVGEGADEWLKLIRPYTSYDVGW